MGRAVLDASAILAALFREPGADVVEAHIDQAIVSAVNLSEVAAKLADRGVSSRDVEALLGALGLPVRAFDASEALAAASLRERTRSHGLSLGDRACLALGRSESLPVITADRAWSDVSAAIGVKVVLLR